MENGFSMRFVNYAFFCLILSFDFMECIRNESIRAFGVIGCFILKCPFFLNLNIEGRTVLNETPGIFSI